MRPSKFGAVEGAVALVSKIQCLDGRMIVFDGHALALASSRRPLWPFQPEEVLALFFRKLTALIWGFPTACVPVHPIRTFVLQAGCEAVLRQKFFIRGNHSLLRPLLTSHHGPSSGTAMLHVWASWDTGSLTGSRHVHRSSGANEECRCQDHHRHGKLLHHEQCAGRLNLLDNGCARGENALSQTQGDQARISLEVSPCLPNSALNARTLKPFDSEHLPTLLSFGSKSTHLELCYRTSGSVLPG